MGGLDARHLITNIRPTEYHPVSMTSISTPHRGSPFMDWCNANVGVGNEIIEEAVREAKGKKAVPEEVEKELVKVPYTLKSPLFYMLSVLDQPAYAMLSTKYMAAVFNPSTPDVEGVKYYSVAARTRRLAVWHPLWLPKLILDAAAESRSAGGEADGSGDALGGELQGNDGLVSVQSAKWGTFLGVVEGCDHWDLRG
ncbi:alpha/beta-hydrolase, partial [Tilletiopsis washingtonensis]